MRLIADSSVWIDFLRGGEAAELRHAIQNHEIIVGDLILAEVLRGIRSIAMAQTVARDLTSFEMVSLCGKTVAIEAASNYRVLRDRGITVRGTIDLIIGTWCVENATPLLHNDRDFFGMEKHLGLRRWSAPS